VGCESHTHYSYASLSFAMPIFSYPQRRAYGVGLERFSLKDHHYRRRYNNPFRSVIMLCTLSSEIVLIIKFHIVTVQSNVTCHLPGRTRSSINEVHFTVLLCTTGQARKSWLAWALAQRIYHSALHLSMMSSSWRVTCDLAFNGIKGDKVHTHSTYSAAHPTTHVLSPGKFEE
jgi:hypothetical protein